MAILSHELKKVAKEIKTAKTHFKLVEDKWEGVADQCKHSDDDPEGGLLCGHSRRNDFFCYPEQCPYLR